MQEQDWVGREAFGRVPRDCSWDWEDARTPSPDLSLLAPRPTQHGSKQAVRASPDEQCGDANCARRAGSMCRVSGGPRAPRQLQLRATPDVPSDATGKGKQAPSQSATAAARMNA